MTLKEDEFHELAGAALKRILQAMDAAEDVDADLREGVLTIELESGATYIVNKHAPNREIWVSSPKSGAWHFAFDAARNAWCDTRSRGGAEPLTLEELLADELDAAAALR